MVPHTRAQYDHTRHLAKGDIIFSPTETNKFRDKVAAIQVLFLPASLLCPVTALKAMITLIPGSHPTTYANGSLAPFTDSMVKKHLQRVLALLGLQNDGYI